MDIRERLTELYTERKRHVSISEHIGDVKLRNLEIDAEIDFLEARYRDQLETQFAMQYATDRAAERAEAGEVIAEELFEMTPNGLF